MTGSTGRVVLIVLVGQQTSFDPANPQVGMAPPPPPQYYGQPQAPQGGLLRGAAGGAALGAVGGGDAGKGAAIGAGVGAPCTRRSGKTPWRGAGRTMSVPSARACPRAATRSADESMKALGRWVAVLGVAVAGLGPGASAAAGKYDGSVPLVCAAATVSECDADGRCQRRNAEKVNFPPLFAVEVKAMKLWELGAEKPRETAIRNVDRANNKMILNGAEGEWGWTVLVNEAKGKMSATAAGDGEGFVIFGQCALS
jgi:hypothetical protein